MLGPYLVTIVVMLVPVPKTSVMLGFIFRDNCYIRVTFRNKGYVRFFKDNCYFRSTSLFICYVRPILGDH